MINHSLQFVFVRIPKSGGSSVKDSLLKHFNIPIHPKKRIGVDPSAAFDDFQNIDRDPHQPLQWYKTFFPNKVNKYFKFSFVRNPYARMVSQFFYLRSGKGPKRAFNIIRSKDWNFKTFVKENGIELSWDWHALKQINFLRTSSKFEWMNKEHLNLSSYLSGPPEIDFIGKTETLQKDFSYVCEKIGLPQLTLPFSNSTSHGHYSTYYDQESKKIVEDMYKEDIEHFKYKFEYEK